MDRTGLGSFAMADFDITANGPSSSDTRGLVNYNTQKCRLITFRICGCYQRINSCCCGNSVSRAVMQLHLPVNYSDKDKSPITATENQRAAAPRNRTLLNVLVTQRLM